MPRFFGESIPLAKAGDSLQLSLIYMLSNDTSTVTFYINIRGSTRRVVVPALLFIEPYALLPNNKRQDQSKSQIS